MSDPKTPENAVAPKFEDAMAELEAIVTAMEGGQMPLEQSLAAYRRGAELLKQCQAVLAQAQLQVRVLDGEVLRVFEDTGAEDHGR
jgi:exodeoxyribonuclease VII small subunit